MFDVTNVSGQTITITKIHQCFFSAGLTANMEVWTRAGGIGTDQTNASGLWVNEGSSQGILSSGPGVADDILIPLTGSANTTLLPGQTVGIYSTSTNLQAVAYTNGTTVGATYASNADITVQGFYGGTYPFGSQFSPRNANVEIFYVLGAGTPTVQVNRPTASLDIGGIAGNGFVAGRLTTCTGLPTFLNLASTRPAATPYDVVIQGGAAAVPGITFPDNIVNINTAPGVPFLLSTGTPGLPPGPSPLSWLGAPAISLPFNAPAVATLAHAQAYWIDPANLDGIALSAPVELNAVLGGVLPPFALGDDAFVSVPFGAPTCAPMNSFSFYGTSYTNFFIASNGEVTFNQGSAVFTPTVAAFDTGMPRVSGMWTDLNPTLGGTITVATTPTDLTVSFSNVATFGLAGITNSFNVVFDTAGQTSIQGYAPNAGHNVATLVGISNGNLGTPGAAVSFDGLRGLPLQASALSTNSVYEFNPAGAVPNNSGFTNIDFLFSDASAYIVF